MTIFPHRFYAPQAASSNVSQMSKNSASESQTLFVIVRQRSAKEDAFGAAVTGTISRKSG
jgi:hypothetical protein